jgi:mono/diheme cytochrome c family protein
MTRQSEHGTPLWWNSTLLCFLVLAVLLSFSFCASANDDVSGPWIAPDEAKKVKNPVKVTPEGMAEATDLFRDTCSLCHGPHGGGDGSLAKTLPQKPANFTDPVLMKDVTDGELFWKMSKGRGVMPAWGEQFSETQRWELVNYLRTLMPKSTPTPAPATKDQ